MQLTEQYQFGNDGPVFTVRSVNPVTGNARLLADTSITGYRLEVNTDDFPEHRLWRGPLGEQSVNSIARIQAQRKREYIRSQQMQGTLALKALELARQQTKDRYKARRVRHKTDRTGAVAYRARHKKDGL